MERALVCAVLDATASGETVAVASDCLEERGHSESAARMRGGEHLSVALERLLTEPDAVFDLLAPMLKRGAGRTAFEQERARTILAQLERVLQSAGGPHTRDDVRARRAERLLGQRWLALLASTRRQVSPNVHAAIDELVATALPSSRGVPWCRIHEEGADRVVVHGAVYDEGLVPCALEIVYDRAERGFRWQLRFDALDEEGCSLDLRSTSHPALLEEEPRWREIVVGADTLEAPILPSLEPAAIWERLLGLIDGEGPALALCSLVEQVDDLLVNGLSLDLHAIHESGHGRLTERGIAELVALRLGESYLTFYCGTRARDATAAELRELGDRCADVGLTLTYATGVLAP